MDCFERVGFLLHEVEWASPQTRPLGGCFDVEKHVVGPRPERAWTLRQAFRWLAGGPFVTGSQVEVLIGHYVHEALYCRGALSVFRAMYTFVSESYHTKTKLWWSCRLECMAAVGIIPLLGANIGRPWSPRVVATDASPRGWGICSAVMDPKLVHQDGRWNERWRYRRLLPHEWAPRRRVLGHDPNTVGPPVIPSNSDFNLPCELSWTDREGFPEVGLVEAWGWRVDRLGSFKFEKHITGKEARVAVWGVAFHMLDCSNHQFRILRLVDNFSVALSFSKGRASNHGMLQQTRRLAALSISCDVFCTFRWIPSEWNPADEPSRRLERLVSERLRRPVYVEEEAQPGPSRSQQWTEHWNERDVLWHEGPGDDVSEATVWATKRSTTPASGSKGPLTCQAARRPDGSQRAQQQWRLGNDGHNH
jgi:hypothetical protein